MDKMTEIFGIATPKEEQVLIFRLYLGMELAKERPDEDRLHELDGEIAFLEYDLMLDEHGEDPNW